MRALGFLVAMVGAAFLTLFTIYVVAVGVRVVLDRSGGFDFLQAMSFVGAAFVAALLLLALVAWFLKRRRDRPAPPRDPET
ncbi:MAG TPA: hypothetical protein PKZ76_11935 [Xanthomonadaceae bacterium]|nr:hypothetical protein [Xanthomonadaceae bacterium]